MNPVPTHRSADGERGQGTRHFTVYLRTLAGAMPGRLALALALTVLGSITEGLGLLILIPLLQLVGVDVQQGSRPVKSGNWHTLLNGSAGRFRVMSEAQGLFS